MSEILTIGDAIDIGAICGAAGRCAPVARALESGDVVYGTARSIGDTRGAFLASDTDVRNGYLRVTTRSGLEAFWPLRELLTELRAGLFVLDYQP